MALKDVTRRRNVEYIHGNRRATIHGVNINVNRRRRDNIAGYEEASISFRAESVRSIPGLSSIYTRVLVEATARPLDPSTRLSTLRTP